MASIVSFFYYFSAVKDLIYSPQAPNIGRQIIRRTTNPYFIFFCYECNSLFYLLTKSNRS